MRIHQAKITWLERQLFRGGKVHVYGTDDEAVEVEKWLLENEICHHVYDFNQPVDEAFRKMELLSLNKYKIIPRLGIVFYTKRSAMAFKLTFTG